MQVDFLRPFIEPDGILCPISLKDLPFEVKRIFYVANVPTSELWRGSHAHKETKQYLICVRGQIDVRLTYDINNTINITVESGMGVLIEEMVWDSYRFLTEDTVALVLCSTEYDPSDYITSFDTFYDLKKSELP